MNGAEPGILAGGFAEPIGLALDLQALSQGEGLLGREGLVDRPGRMR
ncbi:hypothetical protein [Amycolatopsis sulphurea]|nr:hypothetical protein [Amycolatopsis sulphurea]